MTWRRRPAKNARPSHLWSAAIRCDV